MRRYRRSRVFRPMIDGLENRLPLDGAAAASPMDPALVGFDQEQAQQAPVAVFTDQQSPPGGDSDAWGWQGSY